jgi:hypothetical protein
MLHASGMAVIIDTTPITSQLSHGAPTPAPLAFGPTRNNLREYIEWARIRKGIVDQAEAVQKANTVVAITQQKLDVRLDRVFNAERFDARVQEMLTVGLACAGSGALLGAAAGAAIGSGVPVIGTLIGAVAGAVAGVIVGLLNFARFDLFNDTRRYYDSLTPAERYMHFQMFRTLSDNARARDGAGPFPPWRMDFRTAWDEFRSGNADIIYSLFLLLWERDSIPEDNAIIPWALAAATVESQDPSEKLMDQRCYQMVVNNGQGSQWLKTPFQNYASSRCGDLQVNSGLPDYTAIPIPSSVSSALLALPYYQ